MHASKKARNGTVLIDYYDSLEEADPTRVPLLVCPGLSETAEEYLDLLKAVLPRRCITLSFRGRGGSDTPISGYNLDEHISDIESVVRQAGTSAFHLFGFSRGAAYALGFTHKHAEMVRSLTLGDYPPEHRAMPHDWPDDYINNYLIHYGRTANIRPEAVRGIQRESDHINLDHLPLSMPVMVARGKLQDSLVTDADLERYKNMCSRLTVREYLQSGHALKAADKKLFYSDIIEFLNSVD